MYASIIIINVMQNFDEKSVCFGLHMAFFKSGPEAQAIWVNIHWITFDPLGSNILQPW